MAEIFLDFQKLPVEPASAIRSTMILSAIQAIRSRNLFAAYSEALSNDDRAEILSLAGGTWAPIQVALAHYAAVDRLRLDNRTIQSLGEDVASRAWKHVLSPALARSKRIGPKPWESFANAHETIKRSWRGSDVRILKEGPSQAQFVWAGQPCATIPYFAASFAGMMRAITSLFSARARAGLVAEGCSPTSVAVRISWVEGSPEPQQL
jgi:hypothetical protein